MIELRDDPKQWTSAFHKAPSSFDVKAYQAKIDKITGLAKDHSIIRVVWGGEMEEQKAVAFTSHGTEAQTETVGSHTTRVKGVPRKVRIRRWIFEEYQPPAQIAQNSFVRLPGAGGIYIPPSLVQERQTGKWNKWFPVCDHSNCLPEDCNSTEYFCFGDYKEPDNKELQMIAKITRARTEAANTPDPFEALSEFDLGFIEKQAQDEIAAIEAAEQAELDEYYADFKKTAARAAVTVTGK